jgi:hypothetical protein
MSESGGIKYITECSRICRTCLAEKNKEDLCSLFENSLDLILLNLTEISVSPSIKYGHHHQHLICRLGETTACQDSSATTAFSL